MTLTLIKKSEINFDISRNKGLENLTRLKCSKIFQWHRLELILSENYHMSNKKYKESDIKSSSSTLFFYNCKTLGDFI